MKETVEAKAKALIENARKNGKSLKIPTSRNRSSLHKIIKTKEQALVFMKLLKSA
jgi:hypothetical protein